MRKSVLVIVLAAATAFGQKLEFEVARIKPVDPITPQNAQALLSGARRVGLNVSGQQVDLNYLSLVDLAALAYGVKAFDVTAPDALKQQRFEISAVMPEGATREQLPQMVEAMLKDRFKLVARKDTKEQSVYGLEVAKGGHKMKEAPPLAEKPADTPPPNSGAAIQQMRANPGAGGTFSFAAGDAGTQKITVSPDGNLRIELERLTMAQLAETLGTFVDLPVVDKTNLSGAFQVALDLTRADLAGIISKVAGAGMLPAGALAGAPGGGANGLTAADPGGTIMASIQKMGLRLEKTKGPVSALVIESAEKLPTEN